MDSANFTFQVQYDNELFEVYVRLRPHFHEFLEWVSKRFEVCAMGWREFNIVLFNL